ncbi:hypothetical protein [Rheinheimera pacifica]|uniref:hypothetical protein n=1 Tax=Rheinheimera pacifica TaxID=173990 RepID=UPI002EDB022B
MKLFFVAVVLTFSLQVFSNELEPSNVSVIEQVQAYSYYGGGDLIFLIADKAAICKGYWVPKDAPGAANITAMVIAAQKSKSRIKVYANSSSEKRWSGSGTHFCLVDTFVDVN